MGGVIYYLNDKSVVSYTVLPVKILSLIPLFNKMFSRTLKPSKIVVSYPCAQYKCCLICGQSVIEFIST